MLLKFIQTQLRINFKPLILGFILCFFLNFALPVHAQLPQLYPANSLLLSQQDIKAYQKGELVYADVYLDGQSLFAVAVNRSLQPDETTGQSAIERRVRIIENGLQTIVDILLEVDFQPQLLAVTVKELNNQKVIVAQAGQQLSQQVILTVTEPDARLAQISIPALAEEWSNLIQQRLIYAWKERQASARQQKIIKAAQIAGVMLGFSLIIRLIQKWLKLNYSLLKKQSYQNYEAQKSHAPYQLFPGLLVPFNFGKSLRKKLNIESKIDVNLLLQRLLKLTQVFIILGSIAWILKLFPETREQGKWIFSLPLQVLIIWVSISLGNKVTHILINKYIEEWVEQSTIAQVDLQRLMLRAPTLSGIFKGIANFIAVVIGIIWFLIWQRVPLGSVLAGAGVFGAALSLIFQSLIKDWINGILVIFEDQYGVGDIIHLNGVTGFVENMTLRVTQLRSDGGRLCTVPHSQLTTVHNLTKDWSRVDFRIEIAYESDVTQAMTLMKTVAQEMAQDPQWKEDIIDPTPLIGVDRLNHTGSQILMWIKTKRLRQWDVEREYRRRLKQAFDQQGIQIGTPQQSLSLHWDRKDKYLPEKS